SNILRRLMNLGVSISRSDFLSPSNAVLRRMSAPDSSRRRLPTRASSREVVRGVASRMTRASAPIRTLTTTNASTGMITLVIMVAPFRPESHLLRGRHSCLPRTLVRKSSSHLIPEQGALLEQVRRQLDARGLQALHEAGPHPGRLELAE